MKDLEWLAWNWRAWNNDKMFRSRRNLIFGYYNHSIGILPSPEQILHSIILAQMHQVTTSNQVNFTEMTQCSHMWKKIFEMIKNVNFKQPLTPSILADSSHSFVKTLMYIYSMECFLFHEMNKASRAKDFDKIQFYGAFAAALSFIVHCGNKRQMSLSRDLTVYRGLQMDTETDVKNKYPVGGLINLLGFTSTSQDKNTALYFALKSRIG